MNLKKLIKDRTPEILVSGSQRDVKCALSLFDKEGAYEIVLTDNCGEFILRRKQK